MPSEPQLYLVATPIGNLGDISERCRDVLASVDTVASEDTRRTGILLRHCGAEARQVSYHEHNEAAMVPRLIGWMESGKTVALVTNAGTPCISDPGFRLVRAAIDAGIGVSMVPGPSAFLMAVALSGLPVHSFTFRGFPPRKQGPRKRFFEVDRSSPHTLVFHESPYRLVKSMQDALEVFGDRRAAVANELTKVHEEVRRGSLSELLAGLRDENLRGEYVLVIAGNAPSPKQGHSHDG